MDRALTDEGLQYKQSKEMLVSQGARHTYEIQRDQQNLKCLFDFPVQHTAVSCIGNVNNSADFVSTEELRQHSLYSVACS